MPRPLATLLAAALSAVSSAAWGEDLDRALHLRVNPSGYERGPSGSERGKETLDEKVARRMRELGYKFRLICRGCSSAAAEASLERLPDPNARLVPVDEPTAPPGAPAPPGLKAPTSAATAPP